MAPPIAAADELMGQIRREILQIGPASEIQPADPCNDEVPSWQWGKPVCFGKAGRWRRLLVSGWSFAEEEFTWSDGAQAAIEIAPPPGRCEVLLRLSLFPFLAPGVPQQIIRVLDEQRLIAVGVVLQPGEHTFLIPSAPAPGVPLRLFFRFPNATSPEEAGLSADRRKLAVALKWLTAYLL